MVAEPHSSPVIQIVGAEGSGCRSLVRAVVGRGCRPADSPALDQWGAPQPACSTGLAWQIDNKYYTVTTLVQLQRVGQQAAQAEVPSSSGSQAEAVVLVVHAGQPDSLAPVQAWTEKREQEENGVRLLVATHADYLLPNSLGASQQPRANAAVTVPEDGEHGEEEEDVGLEPARPAWLEACRDWCAEHQYEYVEVCSTDASIDALLTQDGDKQGVARVVEALHAHMWPGLVRKPHTARGAAPHAAAPASEQAVSQAQPAAASTAPAEPGAAAADASCEVSGVNSAQDQELPSSKQAPGKAAREQAGSQPSSQQQQQQPGQEQPPGRPDGDMEAELDLFEQLMEQMAAAKQELAGLDDATRRGRAAELALRFAALLDAEGPDSDEEAGSGLSD